MKARYKWLMILGGLILYFLMMVEDSNYDRLYDQNRTLFYTDRQMGWRIDELEEKQEDDSVQTKRSIVELQEKISRLESAVENIQVYPKPIPEHKKFRKGK